MKSVVNAFCLFLQSNETYDQFESFEGKRIQDYKEKLTWEGMARLFIHWTKGRVDVESNKVLEVNLNPCQPSMCILNGWEGDRDELMTPGHKPHAARFENPAGEAEIRAVMARPESTDGKVGSGIYKGDFEHYKQMYDVPADQKLDVFKLVPDELKFSSFVRKFLNNEIDVELIPAFKIFMDDAPEDIEDIAKALLPKSPP